jgi:tetratricopeptide (TPR) repeat protein
MKLRPFVLAAFCSIVVSSFPCPAEAEDLASAAGEPLSLIDHYRLALTVDPDNPILHYSFGSALLAEGLDNEAIAEFRQAYPAFSDSAEMNYLLGSAHSRTGDLDSALLYFDQAEALGALEQPGLFPLANAYYNLGLTCLETDSPDQAARLFAKTLALDPDRQEIRRQLAEIYAGEGQIERALAEFDAYLKVYPDDVTTREYVYTLYFNRAQQSLEDRDLRAARNDFNKALRTNPGSPLAIYYLGCLDYSEGDYEGAAVRLAKIYHASPAEIRRSMDSLLRNSALALLEQKKLRKALVAVEPLIDRQPAALQDLTMAGNIHLSLKEFEAARACFERVLALDPSHEVATISIADVRAGAAEELLAEGRTLFYQREYLEALRKLEAALALHPAHPGALACASETRVEINKKAAALFALAEQSIEQNRPHEALKQLKTGLKFAPDSLLGRDLKEQALEKLGEELTEALEKGTKLAAGGLLQEAERAFAHVLALDPDNHQARDEKSRIAQLLEAKASEIAARGRLALEDGRLAEAREAFEASLKLVPEFREGSDGLARIEVLISAMISEEVQWGQRARSAGRLRQAREHFGNALRLRDDSGLREALDAIDRSMRTEFYTFIEAARKSLKKNDFRRARDYSSKALAQSPQHPDALNGFAEVETRSAAAAIGEIRAAEKDMSAHQFDRALSRYRHVLYIDPSIVQAREGVGRALEAMEGDLHYLIAAGNEDMAGGLLEEAETAFREALILDPYRREAQNGLRSLEQLRSLNVAKSRRKR